MSIHYLINPFSNTGDIIDVVTAESGQTESTGSTVVRVPDGVAIHNEPSNLADLLTAKYAGLMAFYAGFTDILADPCMDASTVDPSSAAFLSSGFVNHCLPATGFLLSVLFPLGFAPTQCVMVWEEYSFTDSDDKTERFRRVYTEESGSNLTGVVFFDGFVTPNVTTNGAVLNIPVPAQGTNLLVGFDNATASRVYLGSWAILYL